MSGKTRMAVGALLLCTAMISIWVWTGSGSPHATMARYGSAEGAGAGCGHDGVLNIVAHEDDDLLFMSPDLLHDVRQGRCVTTVYLTAGDGGKAASYWRRREEGEHAAYARMRGVPDRWERRGIKIDGRRLTAFRLRSDHRITQVFLRLPDGFNGVGSHRYRHQSLQRLWEGSQAEISTVDGSGSYSRTELIRTLQRLLEMFQPGQIRIQDYQGRIGTVGRPGDGDHHDHHAAALFGFQAQQAYATVHRLTAYRGYPIADEPENVSGSDLVEKIKVFDAYAAHDPKVVCRFRHCRPDGGPPSRHSDYYSWLRRQYTVAALRYR